MLFVRQYCQCVAVAGLGGMGKTQVALQFAYWVKEHQPDYSVLWIAAYSQAYFDQEYTEIARLLDVQPNDKDEDHRELLRRHLELKGSGKWFLVIDNIDDMDILRGSSDSASDTIPREGIHKYLPGSENCVILFTTRSPDVAMEVAGPDVVDLGEMSSEEAFSLLEKSLSRTWLTQDKQATMELLEELAYLPLAIAQAAAYLNRNRQASIGTYLKLLRGTEKDMVGLLSRELHDGTLLQNSQRAVATTWLVSFDQIRTSDKDAARLLSFVSCIEPKAIPRSLLPQMETEEETEHAIGTLCAYAFLVTREDGQMFDMHRLVHMATRIWKQRYNYVEEATVRTIHQLVAKYPSSYTATGKWWRAYLPHAIKVLRESERHHIKERYNLFSLVGNCLLIDKRFKEAIKALEEACSWQKGHMSDMDTSRINTEYLLGTAYLRNRQLKDAIVILQRVVAIREQTLDKTDELRLVSERQLGSAYLNDGRVKDAIRIFEYVVAIQKETLRKEDRTLLTSESELASAYLAGGRMKEAISILEHVVVSDQTLEETHHSRLASEHTLASAYLKTGRIKDAIGMLERIRTVFEKTLDETDHDRLASEHALASAYLADRRTKDAIRILERVVAVFEHAFALTDASRLASEQTLASAYLVDKRIKDAILMYEHVVSVQKHTLHEVHHLRLASERQLGSIYLFDNRIKDAIIMFEHVVAVQEQTLNERDKSRLMVESALAKAYMADKRIKDAIRLFEHVVAVRKQTLDETDHRRLVPEHALANAYLEDGKAKQATELLEHIVAVEARILPSDDPSRRLAINSLAGACQALEGRFEHH